ncbi:MAG TPA: tyrosine-protein phosphatase [Gaiellaceae bacterium]
MTALVWDGCVNVRDLGGLPTEDGALTRHGRVVRSDNVHRLSDAGWQALVDHGVTRIVDLRFPEELADDGPGDPPVEIVHVSVLGPSRTAEWQAEQNDAMDEAADAATYLVWSYGSFLDAYRERFAAAVNAIADGGDGAVLVHCMGGKDRTGLITALLLRVAGVPVEVVAADYALTEPALAVTADDWIAAAPDDAERRRRVLMQPAPSTAMAEVLEALEARYGSVADYLRGGGVSDEAIERVRERLVAP